MKTQQFIPKFFTVIIFIVTASITTFAANTNIALNKEVTTSSDHSSGNYPGSKAVDGNNSNNDYRWASGAVPSVAVPQWIEINLFGTAKVSSIKFWTGATGYNTPINDFKFQIWNGSVWQDAVTETGNTNSQYSKTFTEVSTTKVRLYITKNDGNNPTFPVRLYEIEVWGEITSPPVLSTYYVSSGGNDTNDGSINSPFKTIQKAANVMQRGDICLIRNGTYREYINPLRGGISEETRITYKAYPGEKPVIKGSEQITNWVKQSGNVYMADVPNTLFGSYNPFTTLANDPHNCLFIGDDLHLGAVYVNGSSYLEKRSIDEVNKSFNSFFALPNGSSTRIYINYSGTTNPNTDLTEINARKMVISPSAVGIGYITLNGLTICHSSSQFANCCDAQDAMVDVNGGRSWILENCHLTDARMSAFASPGGSGKPGWHIIRNCLFERCDQLAIVGNEGGLSFSLIEGNVFQDINVAKQFAGWEHGAIKTHYPVDLTIRNNIIRRVYNPGYEFGGIWLDCSAQGCRISNNVFSQIEGDESAASIKIEVSHGPNLIDNNIFIQSEGCNNALQLKTESSIVVHNLFIGAGNAHNTDTRSTPWYTPHTRIQAGSAVPTYTDDKYYNNIFIKGSNNLPQGTGYVCNYNAYWEGASKSSWADVNSIVNTGFQGNFSYTNLLNGVVVNFNADASSLTLATPLVTNTLIGNCRPVNQGIENTDGSPITVDKDILGNARNTTHPKIGPFENIVSGANTFTFKPLGISMTPTVAVTNVSLSATSASIAIGEVQSLIPMVNPFNATNKLVSYSSSNTGVAIVDGNGKVTGVAAGTATITTTTQDGNKTATCIFTVVSITGSNLALNKTTTTSSVNSASGGIFVGSKAVDGNNTATDASRWVSAGTPKTSAPEWIEIDLAGSYSISSMKLWTGASNTYNSPLIVFKFQYWNGSEWKDIFVESGNEKALYVKTFSPVTTTKVRLYITNCNSSPVRLYEIEVYGMPLVSSFTIDDNNAYVAKSVVTVNNTVIGTPTGYMISETPTFGNVWQPYASRFNYTLSNTAEGSHSLYFKVKFDSGESSVVSHKFYLKAPHTKGNPTVPQGIISPNPVLGMAKLKMVEVEGSIQKPAPSQEYQVSFYTISGQLLRTGKHVGSEFEFNLSDLPLGHILVKIQGKDTCMNKLIVKN